MYSNKIANLSLLCALLVVTIHVPYLPGGWFNDFSYNWIRCRLAQCAVPIFFVISGYLFAKKVKEKNWWPSLLKLKIKTLVIPFFVINLFFFPIKYSCHYLGVKYFGANASAEVMHLTLVNFLIGMGVWPGDGPVVFPLWFVRALFICFVISPIMLWVLERGRFVRLAILTCLFSLWTLQYKWGLTINPSNSFMIYDLSFKTFFCFSLGIAISHIRSKSFLSSSNYLLSGAFLIIFVLLTYCDREGSFMSELRYNIGTMFAALSLWFAMPDKQLPSIVKGFAFPLYLFHVIIVYLFDIVLKASGFHRCVVSSLGLVPYAVVISILTFILTTIFRKSAPCVAKVVFGGR